MAKTPAYKIVASYILFVVYLGMNKNNKHNERHNTIESVISPSVTIDRII